MVAGLVGTVALVTAGHLGQQCRGRPVGPGRGRDGFGLGAHARKGSAVYSATKHAMNAYSESLRQEVAGCRGLALSTR
jgi:NAD(P)-dependent dehydrogenase (short-subunit alcohol dehydrogenase family)